MSSRDTMPEHVISPDGKYILVDGKWVALPGQEVNFSDSAVAGDVNIQSNVHINSTNKDDEIRNIIEISINKLNNGDMKSAIELFTEAKKIDFQQATNLFEGEYAVRIGSAYADIVENYLVQIVQNNITHSSRYFGHGVVSHDVDGHHKASALLDMLEIAFNNALHFLGDPDDIVEGGFPTELISEEVLDEFGNIDIESIEFKTLKGLNFKKIPVEDAVKQKYRIGLALEAAGRKIMNDMFQVKRKLPLDDINLRYLDSTKSAIYVDAATSYTIKVLAIAIHEGYPLDSWRNDFDAKISLLKMEKDRWQNIKNEVQREAKLAEQRFQQALQQPQIVVQKSDCFIATAAYGTKYEQKIDFLRCWRDTKLLPSNIFSPLVKLYYEKSPPIANFISNKKFLRAIVRLCLAPIIFVIRFSVRKEFITWSDQGNPR